MSDTRFGTIVSFGSEQLKDHVVGLINAGKPAEAVTAVRYWTDKLQHRPDWLDLQNDAHLWFQASLAAHLAGEPKLAGDFRTQATRCEGYSSIMDADFSCDIVLALLRPPGPLTQRQDHVISQRLRNAQLVYHRHGDLVRTGKIYMIRSRYEVKRAASESSGMRRRLGYDIAIGYNTMAMTTWDKVHSQGGDIDPQWVRNNRYHWLRHLVQANYVPAAKEMANKLLGDPDETIGSRLDFAAQVLGNYEAAQVEVATSL